VPVSPTRHAPNAQDPGHLWTDSRFRAMNPPSPSTSSMAGRSTGRRRPTPRESPATARSTGHEPTGTTRHRVINAAPSLEKAELYGIDDERPAVSKVMAFAGRIFIETIPQWLAVGVMLGLIFGGCCSNVFALEAIVKVEPASGTGFPPNSSAFPSRSRLPYLFLCL
jgi:hypothetical protein